MQQRRTASWTRQPDGGVPLCAAQLQDDWWFWLIIGLLCALLVVLVFFSVRGFILWRRHKKAVQQEQAQAAALELAEEGKEPAEAAVALSSSGTSGVTVVSLEESDSGGLPPLQMSADLQRRAGLKKGPAGGARSAHF